MRYTLISCMQQTPASCMQHTRHLGLPKCVAATDVCVLYRMCTTTVHDCTCITSMSIVGLDPVPNPCIHRHPSHVFGSCHQPCTPCCNCHVPNATASSCMLVCSSNVSQMDVTLALVSSRRSRRVPSNLRHTHALPLAGSSRRSSQQETPPLCCKTRGQRGAHSFHVSGEQQCISQWSLSFPFVNPVT